MPSDPSAIQSQLVAFRRRKKFSAAAWRERGLIPSDASISEELDSFFNDLTTKLIAALQAVGQSPAPMQLLTAALAEVDRHKYDTEEAEFVCSVFDELAATLSLSLGRALNEWLYGEELGELASQQADEDAARVVQRLSQPCTACAAELATDLTHPDERNQSESWFGVECLACGELNFLVLPPRAGSMQPVGYKIAIQYWRDRFTKETAQTAFAKAHAKKTRRRTFIRAGTRIGILIFIAVAGWLSWPRTAQLDDVCKTLRSYAGPDISLMSERMPVVTDGLLPQLLKHLVRSNHSGGYLGFPNGCAEFRFENPTGEIKCELFYREYSVYYIRISAPSSSAADAKAIRAALRERHPGVWITIENPIKTEAIGANGKS